MIKLFNHSNTRWEVAKVYVTFLHISTEILEDKYLLFQKADYGDRSIAF